MCEFSQVPVCSPPMAATVMDSRELGYREEPMEMELRSETREFNFEIISAFSAVKSSSSSSDGALVGVLIGILI